VFADRDVTAMATVVGDVVEQSHRGQLGDQRRAAVGEEGQRDSRDRPPTDDRRDVDQRLDSDPRRDAHGDESVNRVRALLGDTNGREQEGDEERDHQQGADEAEFLADDGEDEVGVRIG